MNIAGTKFEFVCRLEPEIGPDGAVVPVMRQDRFKIVKRLPFSGYSSGPFCKFRIPANRKYSGVYVQFLERSRNWIDRFSKGDGATLKTIAC